MQSISIKHLVRNMNKQPFPMDRFTCVDRTNDKLLKCSLQSDLFVDTSTATVFASLKKKKQPKPNLLQELHKEKAENATDFSVLLRKTRQSVLCNYHVTAPQREQRVCVITHHLIMKCQIRSLHFPAELLQKAKHQGAIKLHIVFLLLCTLALLSR